MQYLQLLFLANAPEANAPIMGSDIQDSPIRGKHDG
jgi:hypothetical protein